MHGVHGRRRAGAGETFWQYRPFESGESAHRIDWRRSARGDQLFVREREWEAAQNYFVWVDCSASMAFKSSLASDYKIDRAAVLGLAAAEVLVQGGERVGALGLTPALCARNIIDRLAAVICGQPPDVGVKDIAPSTAAAAARETRFGLGFPVRRGGARRRVCANIRKPARAAPC